MKNILFSLTLLLFSQAANATENPKLPALFGDDKVTLAAGTLVMLETAERFESDQVTVGKELQFRVRTNVMAENEMAIRTGALAIGRVKAIEPATYNNPAEIRIELTYVQAVDGQMIALSGQEQSLRGQFSGQGTAVEAGASITGYVMNDTRVRVD